MVLFLYSFSFVIRFLIIFSALELWKEAHQDIKTERYRDNKDNLYYLYILQYLYHLYIEVSAVLSSFL